MTVAVISTTYDDKYLFYLPITAWVWNKLNIHVECYAPYLQTSEENKKIDLINDYKRLQGIQLSYQGFAAPKHKEATFAQVVRLFAAAEIHYAQDTVLISSDIDMLCFGNIFRELNDGNIHLIGADLLDESMKQIPMCYISMMAKQWRNAMDMWKPTGVNERGQQEGRLKTYQECLDETIGQVESEHFRGCQWSFDQNLAYNKINGLEVRKHSRAKMPERFANNRIDRDDQFWQERLHPDIIDYHCHRPGYTDENFEKILTVIKYFYPNDNLTWMKEYQQQYKLLL